MHHYRFHIGDYASRTRHLSLLEDLAYRRLLDRYHLHEQPLNGCPTTVARLIGMTDHASVVETVLGEFFDLRDGAYHHEQGEEQIRQFRSQISSASAAGKASAAKRRNNRSTTVQRPFNGSATNVQPTNNQYPVPSTQEPVPEERESTAPAVPPAPPPEVSDEEPDPKPRRSKVVVNWCPPCPDHVDPSIWEQYLAIRKAKGLPPTDYAILQISRKAEAMGWDLDQALRYCVEHTHAGFYPNSDNRRNHR